MIAATNDEEDVPNMRNIILLVSIALLGAACTGNSGPEITVYKSATCGCCKKWIAHLEDNNFQVNAVNVANVNQYKQEYGVSRELASCHTAIVDGYVIEGHVPAADIQKLLTEKPKVKGLSVPGMPVGSPGMEQGNRKDPYNVVSFDEAGNKKVFNSYNQ